MTRSRRILLPKRMPKRSLMQMHRKVMRPKRKTRMLQAMPPQRMKAARMAVPKT